MQIISTYTDGTLINFKDEELARVVSMNPNNAIDAILKMYPQKSQSAARLYLLKKLQSKEVRHRISDLMDMQGVSLVDCNEKLVKLLDAQKAIVVDKEIEYVPDNAVQTENLKLAYKLHGAIDDSTNVNIMQNKIIGITLQDDTLDKLKRVNAKLSELTDELKHSESIIINGEVINQSNNTA